MTDIALRLPNGRTVTRKFPDGTSDSDIQKAFLPDYKAAGYKGAGPVIHPTYESYWRQKLGEQGAISNRTPALGERLTEYLSGGLQKLGLSQWDANRLGGKVFGALDALTPVGSATSASDARQAYDSGNYLSAAGNGLGALLGVLPGGAIERAAGKRLGGMFAGAVRRAENVNDNSGLPDALNSLAAFLKDKRPIHEMYEPGDVLLHNGQRAEVVGATNGGLVLDYGGGNRRIVPRTERDLEPAPPMAWHPAPYSLQGYHGTTELFDQFDPALSNGLYHFSDDPEIARIYGHRVKRADLQFSNPMFVPSVSDPSHIPALAEKAKAAGNDGLIVDRMNDVGGPQRQIVAFTPPQLRPTEWR